MARPPTGTTAAHVRLATAAGAVCAVACCAGRARADDLGQLEAGITAYETNRFDECIARFAAMLTPGAPTELTERENRNRARFHHAACLAAKKQLAAADEQLRAIVRDDADYQPNQAAFPSSLVARFKQLRGEFQAEIDKQTAARLAREASEREARERRERAEQERLAQLEKLAGQREIVTRSSRVLALVPFGVGQFQNRQASLGWFLLGAQATLGAASVVSYVVKASIDREYLPSVSDPEAARDRSAVATLVNRLSFGGFAAVAVVGVVHAQLTFVPEYRATVPRPVPPPVVGGLVPGGAVVGWQGAF